MKKLVCLLCSLCFVAAEGAVAGCASSPSADGGRPTIGGGVTVFGTIDTGVSGTRNRSSRD